MTTYGLQINSKGENIQINTVTECFIKNQTGTIALPSGGGANYCYRFFNITPIPIVSHYLFAHKIYGGYLCASIGATVSGSNRTRILVMKGEVQSFTMDWQIASVSQLNNASAPGDYGISVYNDEKRRLLNLSEEYPILKIVKCTELYNPFEDWPGQQDVSAIDTINNYFLLTPGTHGYSSWLSGRDWYTDYFGTLLQVITPTTVRVKGYTIGREYSGINLGGYTTNGVGSLKLMEFEPLA